MKAIQELLDRTHLGEPITRDALTIVPLLREPNGPFKGDYVSLNEALRLGTARIAEITEGGSVPLLAIHNNADTAVLILDGEELLGAKQNRVVNLSILVPGRQTLPIPVSCVERGRWSYRTRNFHASPYLVFGSSRGEQAAAVTRCMSATGRRDGDQTGLWRKISRRFDELSARGTPASRTDAMNEAYEGTRPSLEKLMAGVAPQPHQVGAVFAVGGQVVGAELFETDVIFAMYFSKIAWSYALDALVASKDSPKFEVRDAQRMLDDLRGAPALAFRSVGLGEDLRIEARSLSGGALIHDGRVIHCAAFRVAA